MNSKDIGPAPDVATIGGRLRRLRKERDLTQAELARQIGIQQSDLSRMEKGEYRISLDNLFKILAVFDLQVSEFFKDRALASEWRQRPLSQQDMQVLQLLRELSPEAREEVQDYIEFKARRQRSDRRAAEARKPSEASS
jgi:transcriptional regulator with XRE-family HTH domain